MLGELSSRDSIERLESVNLERKEAVESMAVEVVAVFLRDWWRLERRSSIAWCFFWSVVSMELDGFGLGRSDCGGGNSSSIVDRAGQGNETEREEGDEMKEHDKDDK